MTVKLSDTQLLMLSGAAQREDLCLTAPEKMKGAVLAQVGEKLVKLGLVREVRAKAGTPIWRRDEGGQRYALKLTAAGLKAIAVEEGLEEAAASSEAPQPEPDSDTAAVPGPNVMSKHAKRLTPRTGSKLARVIDLLQRPDGATLPSLTEATGWLPHTTRAALTGLRKRGYAVVRERAGKGESIYWIVGLAMESGDRMVVEPRTARDRSRQPKLGAGLAA
jgi:hypothetical protein